MTSCHWLRGTRPLVYFARVSNQIIQKNKVAKLEDLFRSTIATTLYHADTCAYQLQLDATRKRGLLRRHQLQHDHHRGSV